MRKTMWKGIISGIAAGAFLLSSVPVIAEEVVPLSEDIVEYDDEQYSVDVIEEGAVEEDLEVVDSVEEDLSINALIEDPEEAPDEDAVLMASEENIAINDVNFEDAVFRDLVSRDYDDDEDGYLSPEEISEVEDMYIRGEGIGSLKGIEYFSSLKELYCDNNQLTSLDVSQNLALRYLYCGYNSITNLDVSQNTALMELYCGGNPLQNLDLSKNTNLDYLFCGSCQLTSLDVSQNLELYYLNFEDNMITSVNLSQNTNLDRLYCGGNKLSSLDVSNNTALTGLYCDGNQLTSLNVSNNPELSTLSCSVNHLEVLDISNCPIIKETYTSGEHSNEAGVESYIIYEIDEDDRYVDSALYFDPGVSIKTEAETGHTHTFGAWTVTMPATEDSEGLQVRTCSGCGQTETATVPRVAVNFTISKTPSGVKAKAAAKGKATITWKKFKQTKKTKAIWKKIKKVEVQYSTDPTFKTKISKLVGKAKTKLAVKGLLKNTTYYVRTRYTDGAGGYSKWSGTKKFKTKK